MNTSSEEMDNFMHQTDQAFAEAAEHAKALPPNTVQVWPGGNTFTSIHAAIESISDASIDKQYQVAVGPGVYHESIRMKSYAFVVGAGQGQTIITAAPLQKPGTAVVIGGGDSGIGELNIQITGGQWGSWTSCMMIGMGGKFRASGVTFDASDSGIDGNNVRGITNNYAGGQFPGAIHFASCNISVSGMGRSTTIGVDCQGEGFTTTLNLCNIKASGNTSFGVSTAVKSTSTLQSCTVNGSAYALYDADWISLITANQCTITGAISPGVIVNDQQSAQDSSDASAPPSLIEIYSPESQPAN